MLNGVILYRKVEINTLANEVGEIVVEADTVFNVPLFALAFGVVLVRNA
jgi:hypothetical protein